MTSPFFSDTCRIAENATLLEPSKATGSTESEKRIEELERRLAKEEERVKALEAMIANLPTILSVAVQGAVAEAFARQAQWSSHQAQTSTPKAIESSTPNISSTSSSPQQTLPPSTDYPFLNIIGLLNEHGHLFFVEKKTFKFISKPNNDFFVLDATLGRYIARATGVKSGDDSLNFWVHGEGPESAILGVRESIENSMQYKMLPTQYFRYRQRNGNFEEVKVSKTKRQLATFGVSMNGHWCAKINGKEYESSLVPLFWSMPGKGQGESVFDWKLTCEKKVVATSVREESPYGDNITATIEPGVECLFIIGFILLRLRQTKISIGH